MVVVRDGADGVEVLLLRRNQAVAFHGGAWVFPGGRVDAEDRGDDELAVARRAAVREAREETGLELGAAGLLPFAHWTTPVQLPKRFATWFFVAPVADPDEVRVDNSEIVDHRWLSPAAALAERAAGEIELPGPTFVSLLGMTAYTTVAALAAAYAARTVERFVPRLVKLEGGRSALYAEDAGYETLDFDAPGARHRLVMRGNDWDYVRDF